MSKQMFMSKRMLLIGFAVACMQGCGYEDMSPPMQQAIRPLPVEQYHHHRARKPERKAYVRKPAPRRRAVVHRRFIGSWPPKSGRISNRWTTIVVHHSATQRGGAKSFDKNHREVRGWQELGYHFVIGNGTETPDGAIEIGSRWDKQKHGAHCKSPRNYYNEHGIGICLVGDFTKTRPSRRQLDSLNQLLAYLTTACNIPPSRITTHGMVNHKTACPGKFLSLAAIKRNLAAPLQATVLP